MALKPLQPLLVGIVSLALMALLAMRKVTTGPPEMQETPRRIANEPDNNNDERRSSATPKHGDVFIPGTLDINRLESYSRCYTDPTKYQHHFNPRGHLCSISEMYKLVYFMIAKSGSSTSRYVMKNTFGGQEKKCNQELNDTSKFHFTFFREPTSRFYSSFHEMLVRLKSKATVPTKYDKFLFLFDQMASPSRLINSRSLYDTTHGREILRKALEQFVHDYDAEVPFDGHLRLQIPRVTDPETGRTERLDGIYDTNTMESDFEKIRSMVNASSSVEVIRANDRGTSKHLDVSHVSVETQRKICQLSALDYCCLNYPLPLECKDVVKCQWIHKPEVSDDLLIEPLTPYPP